MNSYDQIADQFSAARVRLQPKEIEYLRLLLAGLEPGSRVLDLGCGTGNPIAVHLVEKGFRVVGVDQSTAMLAIAAARLPDERWVHGSMETVDLVERFAAVVCWDAIFHVPRERFPTVIRNIHRCLMPRGRLMISSGGVVDESGEGFTDTMFGHEFYYDSLSPRQMTALLGESGFDILRGEMCDLPDGERNRGKWATIALRRE